MIFSEKGNVSGNQCWQNEHFIRLDHKENFTLIMSKITHQWKSSKSALSLGGQVLLDFDDWTIIVQQRIRQFRSINNRPDNHQLQQIINAFMQCDHCQRKNERQSVAVCVVTLNYGECDTATRHSPTEWSLRVNAMHLFKKKATWVCNSLGWISPWLHCQYTRFHINDFMSMFWFRIKRVRMPFCSL